MHFKHFQTERRILQNGGQELADYIEKRFEVKVWSVDCKPAKKIESPVEWIKYRLHDAGYLDPTPKWKEEYPITISENSINIARPKFFRTNLKATPIDLVSWIVTGNPYR